MSNSFVNALRKEISSLEDELAGDPRFKKLRRLMAALDAYLEDDADDAATSADAPSAKTATPDTSQPTRTATERTQHILDVAEEIIRESNKPIKTIEILEELRRRNVDVHGREPRNTLSAIISYSGLFKAHGRTGWTIKTSDDDTTENAKAADDPNLAGRPSAAFDEHRPTSGGTRAEPVKPVPGGGT